MDSSSTTLLTTLRALREIDVALALSNLCAYHIAFDRWDDARIHAREALAAARQAPPAPPHENPAARSQLAAVLLGYVDRYGSRVGASRTSIELQGYERALKALRNTLPGNRLEKLMVDGSAITLDEAIELALFV